MTNIYLTSHKYLLQYLYLYFS